MMCGRCDSVFPFETLSEAWLARSCEGGPEGRVIFHGMVHVFRLGLDWGFEILAIVRFGGATCVAGLCGLVGDKLAQACYPKRGFWRV